jgi:hypothetical protein
VNHVKRTKGLAYCGAVLSCFDWAFIDAAHALAAVAQNTTAQPCEACLRRIR